MSPTPPPATGRSRPVAIGHPPPTGLAPSLAVTGHPRSTGALRSTGPALHPGPALPVVALRHLTPRPHRPRRPQGSPR